MGLGPPFRPGSYRPTDSQDVVRGCALLVVGIAIMVFLALVVGLWMPT